METTEKPKLLIVDDDEELRVQMEWALAREYEIALAADRAQALEAHAIHRPFVVTLDLGLPPHADDVKEGFATLADLLGEDPLIKVIVITGRAERAHALEAIHQGAYDHMRKPVQMEELKVILRRAFHVAQLERENRNLRSRSEGEPFEGMLGTSPQMQAVYAAIRKVAASDAPVLVVGESGTGKEMVARAIHRHCRRKDGPFIPIDCGAIPETLLESELFGHEKGAFTGAHLQRRGRIEAGQGGTLFLDEIGELSLPLQVKLLRFLQEHRIERVGGREAIPVDTRVMAATNRDLKQAMTDGRFREDLYYRLGVVVIAVPPLRAREGDLPLLAKTLLEKYAIEHKKKISGFTPGALRAITSYGWPGNVRELENRIKRAVIMTEGPHVTPQDLELARRFVKPQGRGLRDAREALEKELIQQALAKHKGKITPAAADLGISRPTMYELLERLGIRKTNAKA